jgi:hypothetical protein
VVYVQHDADHYEQVERIATAPGARTSFFVPEVNQAIGAERKVISDANGEYVSTLIPAGRYGFEKTYRK